VVNYSQVQVSQSLSQSVSQSVSQLIKLRLESVASGNPLGRNVNIKFAHKNNTAKRYKEMLNGNGASTSS